MQNHEETIYKNKKIFYEAQKSFEIVSFFRFIIEHKCKQEKVRNSEFSEILIKIKRTNRLKLE